MGHSHTDHAGGRHRWRLAVAFALVASYFVVELLTAIISGSLALLSDAGHMAADVVALGAALAATRIATRPDSTGQRTFGSYRAEVFASGIAVLLMFAVAGYVIGTAVSRLGSPVDVSAGPMLVVGALGLVVNVVTLLLLRGGAGESINVRGAYLEVLADTAGSVGVLVAAGLISATGDSLWDTVVALAIGAFVVVRAVLFGRQVLSVLAQHAPRDIDVAEVSGDLCGIEGVEDIHDLHLWCLTSGMNVATAHLVTGTPEHVQPVLDEARDLLQQRYGIAHATLQVEPRARSSCAEVDW